ncbi:MAG: tetratricopeptide repeat protein [Alphaproteobacteria bacterium]|nr:tetratricopeptide repeat protein [Alphaproteobacteria bacterium]
MGTRDTQAAIREFERGNARATSGDLKAGVRHYRLAIAADPDFAPAHVTLGAALQTLGQLQDAQSAFERGVALDPNRAEAHYGLANVHLALGHLDQAVQQYQKALELRAEFPEALLHLGVALARRRQFDLAATAFRVALSFKPDLAEAHGNLGSALRSLGQFDTAEASFRAALTLNPGLADAQTNLGLLLFDQGRIGEAISIYDRAIDSNPGHLAAWRNRIAAVLYDPRRDESGHQEMLRRFEARFAASLQPQYAAPDRDRDPDRPLRVGYVSSDFIDHPIARNLEPVLANRDRRRYELLCYAETPRPDWMTGRLRALADVWRETTGLTDSDVAAQIRTDRVDVLVCLASRLDKGRPLLAAYRPAPVRVSFHDPGTSGLSAMGYLIADRVLVPRNTQERFSERVVALPSFYIHGTLGGPEVEPLPAAGRGHVTFGSFNNPAKVNDQVLAIWGEVLRAVPGARLKLKFKNWFANQGLRERVLRGLGDERSRVEFVTAEAGRGEHLALYHDVDVALDPFPFTGSTTTFEALWMGVPVVTLAGAAMAGRWSASILHTLKLDELIAGSREEYVRIAAGLAGDLARLAGLRAELRGRVAASPLCNGQARARQVERIYRALWRRWCKDG